MKQILNEAITYFLLTKSRRLSKEEWLWGVSAGDGAYSVYIHSGQCIIIEID